MELIKEIGAFAGLAAFLGLAVLALLTFTQGRDLRRLREWAGSAPERDTERKDQVSAAAAERAEELQQLEEARRSEQAETVKREERRRRRAAGLPAETHWGRFRERFTQVGGGLSGVGYAAAVLVVALALGGAAYAAVTVLGGSDEGSVAAGGAGGNGAQEAREVFRPADVEVAVLNGTAVPGLAASYGDRVERAGFELGAVTNTTSGYEDSVVMYKRGSAPEARAVGRRLGIARVRLMSGEVATVSAGAPVAAVVGEDNAGSA